MPTRLTYQRQNKMIIRFLFNQDKLVVPAVMLYYAAWSTSARFLDLVFFLFVFASGPSLIPFSNIYIYVHIPKHIFTIYSMECNLILIERPSPLAFEPTTERNQSEHIHLARHRYIKYIYRQGKWIARGGEERKDKQIFSSLSLLSPFVILYRNLSIYTANIGCLIGEIF